MEVPKGGGKRRWRLSARRATDLALVASGLAVVGFITYWSFRDGVNVSGFILFSFYCCCALLGLTAAKTSFRRGRQLGVREGSRYIVGVTQENSGPALQLHFGEILYVLKWAQAQATAGSLGPMEVDLVRRLEAVEEIVSSGMIYEPRKSGLVEK